MWSEEKMIRLIELIRERPVLWNADMEDYKKRHKRMEAFDEVAQCMGVRTDEVERKWKVLQTQYRREHCKDNGGGTHWFGYKHLSFLKDRNCKRIAGGQKLQRTNNGHEMDSFNSEHSAQADAYGGDKTTSSSKEIATIQEAAIEKSSKRKLYNVDDNSLFFDVNSDDTICVSDVQSVSDNKRTSHCNSCNYRSSCSISRDEAAVYTEHIANKLRKYNVFIRLDVEHKINCILHEADLKLLQDKLWVQQQRPTAKRQKQDNNGGALQSAPTERNSHAYYEHRHAAASADRSTSVSCGESVVTSLATSKMEEQQQ